MKYPYLFSFALLLFAFSDAFAQDTFQSPEFIETIIQSAPGEKLAFTLSGLPDPGTFADSNGSLDVQINWQLGDECNTGVGFSEKVKIKSTTHRVQTNYTVKSDDDHKQLKINVSYVKPTGDDTMPAQGFIAATRNCVTLNISKK